jgi:hypothetical protein
MYPASVLRWLFFLIALFEKLYKVT